jgi:mannan endo-1,4-beta-mannosidase
VSYSVVQQWPGGFQGQFTITNQGTAPINGWELKAVLPFDRIDSVWDAVYHTFGDLLVLDPPSYQVTIPPGGSLTENFTARGGWTKPTSCTFNGADC